MVAMSPRSSRSSTEAGLTPDPLNGAPSGRKTTTFLSSPVTNRKLVSVIWTKKKISRKIILKGTNPLKLSVIQYAEGRERGGERERKRERERERETETETETERQTDRQTDR